MKNMIKITPIFFLSLLFAQAMEDVSTKETNSDNSTLKEENITKDITSPIDSRLKNNFYTIEYHRFCEPKFQILKEGTNINLRDYGNIFSDNSKENYIQLTQDIFLTNGSKSQNKQISGFYQPHPDFEKHCRFLSEIGDTPLPQYLWTYYVPETDFFTLENVQEKLKNDFPSLKKCFNDELFKKEDSVTVYYNRHGICVGHTNHLAWGVSFMDPALKKVEDFNWSYYPPSRKVNKESYNEGYCLLQNIGTFPPIFSVLSTPEWDFLNGEPAKSIEFKEIIEILKAS